MSKPRYISVCSGIEAASVAWHPLGFEPVCFAEIDAFPSAVLAHRWPGIPNVGDFTQIGGDLAADILVGGTPCQSFSIAGKRLGLDDPRGNLAIEFLRLAQRVGARWLVWENVPGVLSANGGRDFGAFLGLLGELGYGWAYRVLDAQYFGVPQQRDRVFLVGCLGDWRGPAAVLFEPPGVLGDLASGEKAQADVARCLASGDNACRRNDISVETFIPSVAYSVRTQDRRVGQGWNSTMIAHTLRAEGFDASEDGTGRGTPMVHSGFGVRRLMPIETERLQGFPDDYTLVPYRGKPAADGPRYKAIGNSMAVPVMRWLGVRLRRVIKLMEPA